MTTVHHTPPPGTAPFAIYEDPEDQEPPSPSDVYDEDLSFISEQSLPEADEPIPSIEQEDEDEQEIDEPAPYRSSYTSRTSILSNTQSRRVSGVTTASFVSELPSEISVASKPTGPASHGADTRYTPRKDRPPFRNPSSVRAMQMASPPPFTAFESPRERLKGTYKLATPSRSGRSETPVSTTRSRRSGSQREAHSLAHVPQSPRPTPTPQQHLPLVLLHVTILPMQLPYTHDMMVKIMPDWLVQNYKLLTEKLEDIVLMQRGLLISHPNEEYDVLEENILESLELKTPRLLKCGHFVGLEEEADEDAESEDEEAGNAEDGTGRGSRMSGGTITVDEEGPWKYPTPPHSDVASVCTDCNRQVKKPGKGIGAGSKRWDLKIYAANGLMRAGAWSAAWREMERCDVEITPWIPADVRKALEKKIEEDREVEKQKLLYEAEVQRLVEEETARLRKIENEAEGKRKEEAEELRKKLEAEEAERQRRVDEDVAEKKKLEDALQQTIQEVKESMRLEFELQALSEAESKLANTEARAAPRIPDSAPDTADITFQARHQSRGGPRSFSTHQPIQEIPLSTLLRNYFLVLARDQRNIALIVLSVLAGYLAMQMNANQNLSLLPPGLPRILPGEYALDSASPIVVTATATTTATFMSTTTVTQIEKPVSSASESTISLPAIGIPGVNQPSNSIASPSSTDIDSQISSEALPLSKTNIHEEHASYSTSLSTALQEAAASSEASTSFNPMPTSSRPDNPLAALSESTFSESGEVATSQPRA
ncbi:hypothetical protein K491DRAFT_765744 [Lophiostoma macrostomum CBS 122681]|uniref:Pathway-specific nitrogen regulator n=1 Tax=Lophiostoma macrostomum CBS 122681 TaxID=1314788 RepID=A0A6A6TLJ4_9PLEO|nr:hypothetical protein K491DRAFT_765744 [Lophiostoma macrostomum CBS 122681]